MKAFKAKRGSETYYRIDLPQRLCPDRKRRSVMCKTRSEAVEKAEEELARWERGLRRRQENDCPVLVRVPCLLQARWRYRAFHLPGLPLPH